MGRKSSLFFIFILVTSLISFQDVNAALGCPDYADSKEEFSGIVRVALLSFLASPGTSKLNANEVSDLAGFYQQYENNFNNANCENIGGASKEQIKVILGKYLDGGSTGAGACRIVERKWVSRQPVSDPVSTIIDDEVELYVKADGFCGANVVNQETSSKKLSFVVSKSGLLAGNAVGKADAVFALENNVWVARGKWKAVREDNPSAADPYYYFQAGFSANEIGEDKSTLLRVKYCKDEDKDGFRDKNCGGSDCNDNAANGKNVYPGAAEICNNIDDDCDNIVDEGLLQCACTTQPPTNSPYYTAGKDECDNWDNNCNGVVDEGVADVNGEYGISMCRANLDGELPACTGVRDFVLFLKAFNSCKPSSAGNKCAANTIDTYTTSNWNSRADFNGDQIVNFDDFFLFAEVFSSTCPGDLKCDSYCNVMRNSGGGITSLDTAKCVDDNGELRMKNGCGGDVNGAVGECRKGELGCLSNVFVYDPSKPVDENLNPYIGLDWYRNNPSVFDILCAPASGVQLKPVGEVCDEKDNDCNGRVDETWLPPAGTTTGNYKGLSCNLANQPCKNSVFACNNEKTGVQCVANTNNPNKPANTLCDDGLWCNGVNKCDAQGVCIGQQSPCPADSTCRDYTCNEQTDSCGYVDASSSTVCNEYRYTQNHATFGCNQYCSFGGCSSCIAAFVSCETGYSDCNNNLATDGCETNTASTNGVCPCVDDPTIPCSYANSCSTTGTDSCGRANNRCNRDRCTPGTVRNTAIACGCNGVVREQCNNQCGWNNIGCSIECGPGTCCDLASSSCRGSCATWDSDRKICDGGSQYTCNLFSFNNQRCDKICKSQSTFSGVTYKWTTPTPPPPPPPPPANNPCNGYGSCSACIADSNPCGWCGGSINTCMYSTSSSSPAGCLSTWYYWSCPG